MVEQIHIEKFHLGRGCPCFIIAEAGVNHNGDLELAIRLIDEACKAGADAIKFQTFRSEDLVSASAPKAEYQKRTTEASESQLMMIKRLELSAEAHFQLQAHCRKREILFLSSPFDEKSADFLEELGIPAFKIPSGEITNLPFLEHLAKMGKPLILSTGMATLSEVEGAVKAIRAAGNPPLILLQCVSNYPADPADINLRAMATMAREFAVPTGYSDHVPGNEVAFAAVALGACVVEKHFTLDCTLPGPDHQASLGPDGLSALVQGIRAVEKALGDGQKRPAASEVNTASVARKSLVAACDIAAGELITASMLTAKRPGTGLSPNMRELLIGRRSCRKISKDQLLSLEDVV